MGDTLKKNAITNLFISIIFIIVGIIFITNPSGVLNIISYIIGGALFLFGGTQLYLYFKSNTTDSNIVNVFLFTAIFSIVLGLIIIIFSSFFAALIRIIIGFMIIYSGITKLKVSIDMKNLNINSWIYMFSISLIVILCGLYVLLTSGIIFSAIGVVTIVYGILSLIQNIMYIKNINRIVIK